MCSRVKSAARDYSRPVRVNVTSPFRKPRLFCGPSRADAVRPASTATTSKFITAVYGGGRPTTLR